MSLKVYNVLNRKKEEFKPIEPGKVKMYACGITVSGDAHIGHAYQAIVFDIVRKYLEYIGYDVTYVRNYTDVDDKIILKARELGEDPAVFAKGKIDSIEEDFRKLRVDLPTIQSKATECIDDMIAFIQKLIDKGYAYSTEDGNVYFEVSKFKEYGRLSHQILDEQLVAVRKELEPGKLNEKDFALWKNAKDDEIWWNSPWGKGRPGWHIECSTMSMKYLGETIDIHGGGRDLVFPHHENEIAQTEALTGKKFANYWIHNGLIKVNNQKMSKSLNNSILLKDLLNEYNFEVIKFTLESNVYRSDLNVIDGIFEEKEKQLYSIYKTLNTVDNNTSDLVVNVDSDEYKEVVNNFETDMNDDFNYSLAVSRVYDYMSRINKLITEKNYQEALNITAAIRNVYKVIGLFSQNPIDYINEIRNKFLRVNNITEEYINDLIIKRKEYKIAKNYEEADKVRNLLLEKNIILNDTREGTFWEIG